MAANAIRKEFEKLLNSRKLKTFAAREGRDIIRKRTQAGRGVSNDRTRQPNLNKLPDVSEPYSRFRRRVANRGFPAASGRKSRATLTGQMLAAMDFRLVKNGFLLFFERTRRKPIKVKGLKARRGNKAKNVRARKPTRPYEIHSKIDNRQLAKFFGQDRPFFAFAKREQRILLRKVDDIINKQLKLITRYKLKL